MARHANGPSCTCGFSILAVPVCNLYTNTTQVHGLGLMIGNEQEKPTAAALGRLFDAIDADHSGLLDLREASAALKGWQAEGQRAYAEKAAKARELQSLRVRAGQKLQDAIREPETQKPADTTAAAAGESVGGGVRTDKWRARIQAVTARRKEASAQRKAALAERAQEQTQVALHFLQNHAMSRGWLTWRAFMEETLRWHHLLEKTLLTLSTHQQARSLRTWCSWHEATLSMAAVLVTAATKIAFMEEARIWYAHSRAQDVRRMCTACGCGLSPASTTPAGSNIGLERSAHLPAQTFAAF